MAKSSETHQGLRTFYTLTLTQTLSILGSRMSGFAVALWITSQTGDVTPIAMVWFFGLVPMILLSNVAGVVADRWDRRHVMALADAGQAVASLLLLFLFASGQFQLWHLYVISFIESMFGIFQQPASEASITMLVPDSHRDRANAIRQMVHPAAGILAPALAGVLIGVIGVTGIIVIDLLTFLVAITVVLLIHIPRPERSAESTAASGSPLQEALGGVRFLWSRRPMFSLMMYASLVNFAFGAVMAGGLAYVLLRTGNQTTAGILNSVQSLAALLGALVMSMWGGTRPRIHTILPAITFMAVGLVVVGVSHHPILIGIGMAVMMFPNPFANASAMSLMQAKVPPDMQGRVFSVVMQISMLLQPIGLLLVGPIMDQVVEPAVGKPGWEVFAPLVGNTPGSGIGLVMVMAGAAIVVTSLLMYAWPYIRNMESTMPDYVATPGDEEIAAPALHPETVPTV